MTCPCANGLPDPCPSCGATVSGNDPVNGVCQDGIQVDKLQARIRELEAEVARLSGDDESTADLPALDTLISNLSSPGTPFAKLIGGSH